MQRKILIILVLAIWPIALFLNNTLLNSINYFLPIFEPKFAILPLIFVLTYYRFKKPILIFISILILIISFNKFYGQTIFTKDYESEQKILREQTLYPNIFLARLFNNKPRIIFDKFTSNLFAITDPNNYFFGFAPRQITIDNQNLKKFPFLSLPFLLIGLINIEKIKYKKLILSFLIACIVNLSILKIFDRNDFILWLPISLIIINGINILYRKKYKFINLYSIIFIICSTIELIRLFYY